MLPKLKITPVCCRFPESAVAAPAAPAICVSTPAQIERERGHLTTHSHSSWNNRNIREHSPAAIIISRATRGFVAVRWISDENFIQLALVIFI